MTEHDRDADTADSAAADTADSPDADAPGDRATEVSGRDTEPDQTAPSAETTATLSEPAADQVESKPIAGLMVAYAVGRLGIFVTLGSIFWAFGFRGLPGLLAAALISIPLSFVALKVWRVELARRIEERKSTQLSMKDAFRTTGRD